MKSRRLMLPVVLIALATVGLAQSDAQKSFAKLKTLTGSWEGTFEGKSVEVSLRVTSMGNALMHEMTHSGGADDPITMFYVDGDRLLLTHYCDAGNRPRMVGRMTPDGKSVEFDLLDVADFNSTQMGHMQHVVLTMVDANHHTEDWTFMLQGGKPAVQGHLELERTSK